MICVVSRVPSNRQQKNTKKNLFTYHLYDDHHFTKKHKHPQLRKIPGTHIFFTEIFFCQLSDHKFCVYLDACVCLRDTKKLYLVRGHTHNIFFILLCPILQHFFPPTIKKWRWRRKMVQVKFEFSQQNLCLCVNWNIVFF